MSFLDRIIQQKCYTSDDLRKLFATKSKDVKLCLLCRHNNKPDKLLKCKDSSTNALHKHLTSKSHNLARKFSTTVLSPSTSTLAGQKKLAAFGFNSKAKTDYDIKAIICQLLIEGVSMHQCTQKGIQFLLQKAGYSNIPTSPSTISRIVIDQYQAAKVEIKSLIAQYISKGFKVSISMDEWSSCAMRKYLNVIVHFNGFFLSIALIRMKNEDDLFTLFRQKLEEFGIDLSDVISVHSDGASQMRKFSQENVDCAFHYFCLVHAMHNAIKKTFYLDVAKAKQEEEEDEEEEEDDENSCGTEFELDEVGLRFSSLELRNFLNIYRNVVRKLRRSTKKFETFQKLIEEFNQEETDENKKLNVDCRPKVDTVHRFAYIFDMLAWVLKYRVPIDHLFDIEARHWTTCAELLQILKPIKDGILKLSEKTANYLTAESVLINCLIKAESLTSELARQLFFNFKCKVNERRQNGLISLLLYLQAAPCYEEKTKKYFDFSHEFLNYLSVRETKVQLLTLAFEKFKSQNNNIEKAHGPQSNSLSSIDEIFNNFQSTSTIPTSTFKQKIISEIKEIDLSGRRGPILEKIYQSLTNVLPSSIACERLFSNAGKVLTKTRNRMSDNTLEAIVNLFYYEKFKN